MSVLKSIYMLKVSPALHPHAGVQHLFMEVARLETVARRKPEGNGKENQVFVDL